MASPAWTLFGAATTRSLPTLGAALFAAALAFGFTSPASANSRYAALVMNADSGDVIYSRSADMRRYPASLTKLMTLYLLFEAIEDGRLEMDDELHVSPRAAGQPPSKLGVESGSTISVEDAIQALVVRSANDVAVVVAEALADTEWSFSRQMTSRAQEMGMDQTRFENASGLPHQRQQTTARDLSILALRIVNDFPQHMHYFSQPSFTYNDRTWDSHNNLLEDYDGTTGLKTGYTRASGFNLIATVERDDISLIGIVMGGRTAARRDQEMERILDLNFARLRENPSFGSRVFTSEVRPHRRPHPDGRDYDTPAETLMAAISPDILPAPRPQNPLPEAFAASPSPELSPSQDLQRNSETRARTNDLAGLLEADLQLDTSGPAGAERQRLGDAGANIELALNDPAGAAGDIDPTANPGVFVGGPSNPSGWGINIGAFRLPDEADRRLQSIAASVPTLLTWGMAAIIPAQENDQRTYAAGFGPMSEAEAVAICSSLAQQGFDCQPTDTVDWDDAIRR